MRCDAGCNNSYSWLDKDMWRVTRAPYEPVQLQQLQALQDHYPTEIQVSGPEHMWVCPDCWHAATGFIRELNIVRQASNK